LSKQDKDKAKVKAAPKKKRAYNMNVYSAWCKACGICIEFCPTGVLGRDKENKSTPLDPTKCIGCMQCVLRCPDFAITVEEKKNSEAEAADSEKPETTEG
jgi:2-oxoglutarate ferredoxin oxidoreductase subunit delta